jgi:hypothetical protein
VEHTRWDKSELSRTPEPEAYYEEAGMCEDVGIFIEDSYQNEKLR